MKHWQKSKGISLIEMMLVLAVIAIFLLAAMSRFVIKKDYFQWNKNVAQAQSSVALLLQAGNVYFYANCHPPAVIVAQALTKQNLVTAGGLTSGSDAFKNPWGADYTISIVSANKGSGPPYAIQVSGDFNKISKPMVGQLAQVLNADAWAGGNTLTWTQLPSLATANLGTWYGKPANVVAVNNAGAYGGTQINSNLWVMKSGMDFYAKSETLRNQQVMSPCLNLSNPS